MYKYCGTGRKTELAVIRVVQRQSTCLGKLRLDNKLDCLRPGKVCFQLLTDIFEAG